MTSAVLDERIAALVRQNRRERRGGLIGALRFPLVLAPPDAAPPDAAGDTSADAR